MILHLSKIAIKFDTTDEQQRAEEEIRELLQPLGAKFVGYHVINETLIHADSEEANLSIVVLTTDPASATAILYNEGYIQ